MEIRASASATIYNVEEPVLVARMLVCRAALLPGYQCAGRTTKEFVA